jgi:hypothetical protein
MPGSSGVCAIGPPNASSSYALVAGLGDEQAPALVDGDAAGPVEAPRLAAEPPRGERIAPRIEQQHAVARGIGDEQLAALVDREA